MYDVDTNMYVPPSTPTSVVIQGEELAELPERLLGTVRFMNLNLPGSNPSLTINNSVFLPSFLHLPPFLHLHELEPRRFKPLSDD